MPERPCILFTAFEPSGDEHAAPVIRELRTTMPDAPIYALGGERMRDAGAVLIEPTVDRAAMLGGAVAKVAEHRRLRRRLWGWLNAHRVAVHVPTDSPAANWGICRMVKRRWGAAGAKVAHLVAPQVWAWAPWRARRLRQWSDLVLCVLPFEPAWFARHGVEARFIGHPLFDAELDLQKLDLEAAGFPQGQPRIALLPGSRVGEIAANWPVMIETFRRLRRRYPRAVALVAAAGESAAQQVRRLTPALPEELGVVASHPDAVIHWSEVVLTVSGTATLHVARHARPMAVLYRVGAVPWHTIGRWLVETRTLTLPNLIAAGGPEAGPSRHIVREFVPFIGGPRDAGPIADELGELIDDRARRERQTAELGRVAAAFRGRSAGREAAAAIAGLYRI